MRSFALAAIMAITQAADLTGANNCDWSIETVVPVYPPDPECCEEGGNWNSDTCNPIQNAVDEATDNTWIKVFPGTYCNKNLYKNAGKGPQDGGKSLKNSVLVRIDGAEGQSHIKIEGVDANGNTFSGDAHEQELPLLKSDGWGAIQIRNSSHVTVKYLELEGSALQIDGVEASE